MSYTACDLCGEMLLGYQGSACTNPLCRNAARPGDRYAHLKSDDGQPYRRRKRAARDSHSRAMKRAFKGIR